MQSQYAPRPTAGRGRHVRLCHSRLGLVCAARAGGCPAHVWPSFRDVIMDSHNIPIPRLLLKATLLFVTLNLILSTFNLLPSLGRLTLYNWLLPGRQRLPYGDDPQRAYNLSLYNLEAMFASHELTQAPKAEDE